MSRKTDYRHKQRDNLGYNSELGPELDTASPKRVKSGSAEDAFEIGVRYDGDVPVGGYFKSVIDAIEREDAPVGRKLMSKRQFNRLTDEADLERVWFTSRAASAIGLLHFMARMNPDGELMSALKEATKREPTLIELCNAIVNNRGAESEILAEHRKRRIAPADDTESS